MKIVWAFPPPNVAYFVVLLRTRAWHNCKGKMQHFLLLKAQVKSDLVRGNNFWIQPELQPCFNRFVTLFYATISRTAAPVRLNIITRKLNLGIINVPKGQKQYYPHSCRRKYIRSYLKETEGHIGLRGSFSSPCES